MKEPVFIEQAIKAALLEDAELAALLGDKIFPVVIPQGVKLPCAVYQRSYSQPEMTLLGYQSEQVTMQVTAFSFTYAEAKAIALRIRAAMAGAEFKGVFVSDRDDYDPDSQVYITSAEYICEQTGGYCHG